LPRPDCLFTPLNQSFHFMDGVKFKRY